MKLTLLSQATQMVNEIYEKGKQSSTQEIIDRQSSVFEGTVKHLYRQAQLSIFLKFLSCMKINTNFYSLLQLMLTCSFSKIHYITIRYVKLTMYSSWIGTIYIHAARSAERPKLLNRMLKHGKDFEPRMRGIHLQRTAEEAQTQCRQGQRLHSPRTRQSTTSSSPSNMTLLNLSIC